MKRNLDKMMGDFDVKQENLQFDELSELEKKRILAQTLQKAGLKGEETMKEESKIEIGTDERQRKTTSKRRIVAVAVAAVLVVGSVCAFAASGLPQRLSAFLNPTEDQELVLAEGSTLIDKKVENNGTTVWVKETVGDKNAVYILLDLIAPEGTVLDAESYSFDQFFFSSTEPGSFGMGYSIETLADDNPGDNKLTFVICGDSGHGLAGRKMSLSLKDLRTYSIEKRDYVSVLSGQWDTEFKLDYKDISKSVKVDADVQAYGDTANVKEISASPLSISVVMNGKGIAAYDENPPEPPQGSDDDPVLEAELQKYFDTYNVTIGMKLKDGTVIDSANQSGSQIDGSRMIVTSTFGELIAPENLAAVIVNGVEIPVEFK